MQFKMLITNTATLFEFPLARFCSPTLQLGPISTDVVQSYQRIQLSTIKRCSIERREQWPVMASDDEAVPIRRAINPGFSHKALIAQEPMSQGHVDRLSVDIHN